MIIGSLNSLAHTLRILVISKEPITVDTMTHMMVEEGIPWTVTPDILGTERIEDVYEQCAIFKPTRIKVPYTYNEDKNALFCIFELLILLHHNETNH